MLEQGRGRKDCAAVIAAFLRDESGIAAIQYGLVAGIISLGIMITVNQIPGQLNAHFATVVSFLSN